MSAPDSASTLYVSDLDGTLLGPGGVLSDRTRLGVNALVRDGWLFTYATARSWVSASRVVAAGLGRYLADRPGDPRFHPVATWAELPREEAFYATVIDDAGAVDDLVSALATATDGRLTLIPQVDAHHPEDTYLELSAAGADKAGAVARLRELVEVDRVVAFGDNLNDLPMFAAADEAYAVDNAVAALRAVSTGVIDSNTDDGVVSWLTSRAGLGPPPDPTPPVPV